MNPYPSYQSPPDPLRPRSSEAVPRSAFWSPPSQNIFWQHFVSSTPITYPVHTHPEHNIVVCLRGAVQVRQCGEVCTAEPGEALIGNALIPHQSVYLPEKEHCEAVSLTISTRFLRSVVKNLPSEDRTPVLVRIIREHSVYLAAVAARQWLLQPFERRTAKLESLAHLLAAEVFGRTPRRAYEALPAQQGAFLPRWQYVRSHEAMLNSTNLEFSVSRVARELGVSPGRFHLLFRSSTGTPPAQYFHELLMARARNHLLRTSRPVKQISYDLGFSSPSHFCSAFKRHWGMSPQCYREAVLRTESSESFAPADAR